MYILYSIYITRFHLAVQKSCWYIYISPPIVIISIPHNPPPYIPLASLSLVYNFPYRTSIPQCTSPLCPYTPLPPFPPPIPHLIPITRSRAVPDTVCSPLHTVNYSLLVNVKMVVWVLENRLPTSSCLPRWPHWKRSTLTWLVFSTNRWLTRQYSASI